jgi:hypothetical protein
MPASRSFRRHSRGWMRCLAIAPAALLLVATLGSAASAAPEGQVPDCGPMDVIFVVDDTGSMQPAIDNVKSEVGALISAVEDSSNHDFQMGLVTFRDTIEVDLDLGSPVSDLRERVMGLVASGGDELPEASDEAMNTVINGLDQDDRPPGSQHGDFDGVFRPEALKIVVLITDALPAGFDDDFDPGFDDVNADLRAHEAADAGMEIAAVFVPGHGGDQAKIAEIMQNYADVSRGDYTETNTNGTGTVQAIQEIIEQCPGGVEEVELDVMPGKVGKRLPVDPPVRMLVTVAVLSEPDFDAGTVDVSTVCFGDADDASQRDCTVHGSEAIDVEGDGDVDLVVRFELNQTGIDAGDESACLTGTIPGEDRGIGGCAQIRTA